MLDLGESTTLPPCPGVTPPPGSAGVSTETAELVGELLRIITMMDSRAKGGCGSVLRPTFVSTLIKRFINPRRQLLKCYSINRERERERERERQTGADKDKIR